MPGKPGPPAHAPVAFDEAAWSEDLRNSTDAGRAAATRVPWPNGKWGIVYLIARDKQTGRLSLDILAFGIRHHPKDSHTLDVYETADRRLHNAIIARDLRTEKPPTTPNDQTQDG
jgi:hypothetical protein